MGTVAICHFCSPGVVRGWEILCKKDLKFVLLAPTRLLASFPPVYLAHVEVMRTLIAFGI
jgi:hypothetical protein